MSQTIRKWGNSLAYRIPKAYADQLHWDEDTEVVALVVDGKLVIGAASIGDIPVYNLEELLIGVTPELVHGEISTGYVVGNEEW